MTKQMTLEQKRLLEPYGELVLQMEQAMEKLSTDELEHLMAACAAATNANCWACSFRAVQMLLPSIRGSLSRRKFTREQMQQVS